MNFFSGTKILQRGGMFKQWETFFCLPEYVSFVSYVQINVYACVYIFKKKILSETLTSGKSKCSIPRGIDFFLNFAVDTVKNKSRKSDLGVRGGRAALGSQLWCSGVCLRGLMCRHCPPGYFIHPRQRLLQQVVCRSKLKQCLQIDSSN